MCGFFLVLLTAGDTKLPSPSVLSTFLGTINHLYQVQTKFGGISRQERGGGEEEDEGNIRVKTSTCLSSTHTFSVSWKAGKGAA